MNLMLLVYEAKQAWMMAVLYNYAPSILVHRPNLQTLAT